MPRVMISTISSKRLVGALFAALGVLGIAIVCAILLAQYIARPIRKIAAASDSVGHFELSNIQPLERSRIKELDEQAVAFNRMLDGLRWFETYVPKTLVSRLIAGHETSVPSGEMEVTVMFTDIIGFYRDDRAHGPGRRRRHAEHPFRSHRHLHRSGRRNAGQIHRRRGDGVLGRPPTVSPITQSAPAVPL